MATRERQRARTRQAILDAATAVIDGGAEPTIDAVVEASGISRATVYRYFDSVGDMVWHAAHDRITPGAVDAVEQAGPSPVQRIAAAEVAVNDIQFGDPDGVRRIELSTLSRILDGRAQETDRPARRLTFIDAALAPVADRLDPDALFRLRYALALALGSEAFIAMSDVCRLDDEPARSVTAWAAQALVRQACAEAGIDPDLLGDSG